MEKRLSEKIEDLARQAGATQGSIFPVGWFNGAKLSSGNWKMTPEQLQEFYKLTVESCARVIESEPLTDTVAAQHLRRRMLGK